MAVLVQIHGYVIALAAKQLLSLLATNAYARHCWLSCELGI
jgi:hypothetical protein